VVELNSAHSSSGSFDPLSRALRTRPSSRHRTNIHSTLVRYASRSSENKNTLGNPDMEKPAQWLHSPIHHVSAILVPRPNSSTYGGGARGNNQTVAFPSRRFSGSLLICDEATRSLAISSSAAADFPSSTWKSRNLKAR
jgi:hypothetical protein